MEKKTGSYYKQLTKAMDVFVALVAGLVLAAVLFVVEWKDLFAIIMPTYATVLQTMFNGGVLMAIVCCFVALLISLKEKSVVKIDALLVALTVCSVGGAVLFGGYASIQLCSDIGWSFFHSDQYGVIPDHFL